MRAVCVCVALQFGGKGIRQVFGCPFHMVQRPLFRECRIALNHGVQYLLVLTPDFGRRFGMTQDLPHDTAQKPPVRFSRLSEVRIAGAGIEKTVERHVMVHHVPDAAVGDGFPSGLDDGPTVTFSPGSCIR